MSSNNDRLNLLILLAVFGVLAVVFSLFLPLGESADEVDHFALVRFIADEQRIPLTVAERTAIGKKGDASPLYHALVAGLTQHVDVSDLPELPLQTKAIRYIPFDGSNGHIVFHTEDELFPFRGIVLAWHLGRLLSVLLGMATIVGVWLIARAIFPERPNFALTAAGFTAFIPRFLINSSVINDDNLVVPLATFSMVVLVRILQGDTRRRAFALLGVLMGLAAVAKYHSLVLPVEASFMLALLARRQQWRTWRKLLARWGVMMGAFALVAGGWFAFVFVRFNQIDELGWLPGILAALGDPVTTSGGMQAMTLSAANMLGWLRPLFRTFWITYGGTQVFAPDAVYQLLALFTLVSVIGLLYWLIVARRTHTRWRLEVEALVLHLLIFVGIVFVRYQISPVLYAAQGRHLFPALSAIAILWVWGFSQSAELLRAAIGKINERQIPVSPHR